MHDTLLEGTKFSLDHFDRYENTYFLAGWVHSENRAIASLRVEAINHFNQEVQTFDIRHDVNKFYSLPDQTRSGFKFILTPDTEFPSLIFSVRFEGEENFKVIKDVSNPRYSRDINNLPVQVPQINIGNPFPGMVVVEDFYDNPDLVREYAMAQSYQANDQHHKGSRTQNKTIFPGTKEFLEGILHKKITNWDNHIYNGVFQYCTAQDALVYHTDNQTYAAVVFLTPDAPPECGTSFYKSRFNGLMHAPTEQDCKHLNKSEGELVTEMFAGNYYDKTRWETVDVIGNVYNRMVLWDAKKVHAASEYFGDTLENSRLFHMFFFDAE
ncbi:MAG: DUF6445 family protein [Thiolinea sp.]